MLHADTSPNCPENQSPVGVGTDCAPTWMVEAAITALVVGGLLVILLLWLWDRRRKDHAEVDGSEEEEPGGRYE